jgi:ATP-dependent Clp protease ATP-binding subunit ClpA
MDVPEFSVDVFQNRYLPPGGREVNAIVTVRSDDRASTTGAKTVAGVALRVWTPQRASISFVKQVAPTVEDLTHRRAETDPQSGDYPTGAWGAGESRDYHLCLRVDPAGAVGQEMLAARISLVIANPSGPEVLGHGRVLATWTDDEELSAKVVVEVIDPVAGTVRLRKVADADRKARDEMFERFTDRARRVVVLAQEEARMLNHNYIGTEHILLGLIHEGEGVAARALESLGISLEAVRQQVEEIIGQGQQAPSGHIPFTPRAKKVLELSLREALQLGHNYIGTEHILLGLIREGDGVAAQVLVRLGADLNRVRQQVIQLLHGFTGDEPVRVAAYGAIDIRAVESRLSAVEQRLGLAPDTGDLDREMEQARRERSVAVAAQDYERAALLRDREKELLVEIASRREQWSSAHPDLPSLAEQVRQLSEEIEKLRGLLRQQGAEPEEGTS